MYMLFTDYKNLTITIKFIFPYSSNLIWIFKIKWYPKIIKKLINTDNHIINKTP